MEILGFSITRTSEAAVLSRAKTITLVTAGLVVVGAGTAWAVWTSTGTGSGTGAARSFQAITVAAGSAATNQLYPGASNAGDLTVTATNPNPFPVTVTVTSIGTVTGCTTPAVTLTATATFTLTANQTSASKTMSNVLSMGTTSSDDCQGKTLTIPVNTSAVSS